MILSKNKSLLNLFGQVYNSLQISLPEPIDGKGQAL